MSITTIAPTCLTAEQVAEITEAARDQIDECDPKDLDLRAQWLSDWGGWVIEGWDELAPYVAQAAHEEACELAERVARKRVAEILAEAA